MTEQPDTIQHTERQVAQQLGIPQTWIATERRAGRIPHHSYGRWIRYTTADIQAILDRHHLEANPEPPAPEPTDDEAQQTIETIREGEVVDA